uniref:Leucine-rich alpha-2-glycoprotein 1 n=1 Tax=Jaculus jaculus TaxID=51337 RepID=A0A8C5KRH8_JACJA
MSSWRGHSQQSLGGLTSHLCRALFLLGLFVASAWSVTPTPQDCLILRPPNSHGSSVSCFSAPEFPSWLPGDTIHLTMEFSNLTQLPAAALHGCPGLRELHLSSNRLEKLSAGLLLPVPNLLVLDLTRNALADLPQGLFRASAALHTLVLKENRLQTLQASWLRGLRALVHLDLAGNCLHTLPAGLLANLTALSTLDLGDNQLETLPPGLLRGPLRLERLHLEGNQLRVLGDDLLAPQPSLRYLFLNDNKLTSVAAGAFKGLKWLDMLDLSNNSLTTTPAGLWASLGKPARDMEEGFDLSHNPWVCDQKLSHLCLWLAANRHKMFSKNETRCAGPKDLEGQLLLAVVGSQW